MSIDQENGYRCRVTMLTTYLSFFIHPVFSTYNLALIYLEPSCKVDVIKMGTIALSGAQHSEIESEVSNFVPLTAEQAKAVRQSNPSTSPWWVVAAQVALGGLIVALAWAVFGDRVARSMGWGVMAVVIPAALFARGVTSKFAAANPGTAVMSFFLWELVKIVVTLGVLFAAHRLMRDLSWPAMLVGLIITMKVYWLALAFRRKGNPVQLINA